MREATLLRTRLRPPRLPGDALERPHLIERAQRGIERGRVLVVAGAGFGKSTFLTQLANSLEVPWAWCSCDTRITEPLPLLTHIAAGIEERVPGFGAALRLEGSADDQVAALCNEIDATIGDALVLFIDDVHLLIGTGGETVLRRLVQDVPASVALVISGRALPDIPLHALRAAGLEEIGAPELALSADEVAVLARGLGHTLDDDRIAALHIATEGWVAGVLLAGRSQGLSLRDGPIDREELFDYLATEVLSTQPPDVLRVMESTGILTRFTPEIAEQVSGVPDAGTVVRRLAAAQMFTIRLEGGEWYRYHHLLRDVLRARVTSAPVEARRSLHLRAAEAWLDSDEPLEAARHFVVAGDLSRAADTLEPHAEVLGSGPDGPALADLLDALPAELLATRSGLLAAHSALQLTLGRHEQGFASAEAAIARLVELGEHDRAAVSLFRHIVALLLAGMPPHRRYEAGERFLPSIAPCPHRPLVSVMQAGSLAYMCRWDEARVRLAAARQEAGVGPSVSTAWADAIEGTYLDVSLGRPARGLELLEQSFRDLEAQPGPLAVHLRIFVLGYTAYVTANLGLWDRTLDAIRRSTELMAANGIVGSTNRALQWWRMVALAGLERWEELATLMQSAGQRVGPGSGHYGYRQRGQAALLAAHTGDVGTVIAQMDAALPEMADHQVTFDHPWVLGDFSTALLRAGETQRAAEVARDELRMARDLELPWEIARASLRLAAADSGSGGDTALAEALGLSSQGTFDILWSRRERTDAGPLLARAIRHALGPPGVALRIALACGGEVTSACLAGLSDAPVAVRRAVAEAAGGTKGVPAEAIEALLADTAPEVRGAARSARHRRSAEPRVPLAINGFGGLTVDWDGAPIPRAAFGREKARQLLAALLAARRPVHREMLFDWLWPDLDLARASRAFHVTLHALRRALEPDLPPRAPSSVVALEGEAYRLVLGEKDRFDIGEFLELASTRPGDDQEIARLEAAAALSQGEVFPEWPYAPWAEEIRTEVAAARVEVRRRLGDTLMAADRPGDAARHLAALVDLEPEREEWHRALMTAYAEAGERALALRQFHACRTILRRELAIDVGPETRALYTAVLTSDEAPAAV